MSFGELKDEINVSLSGVLWGENLIYCETKLNGSVMTSCGTLK